MSSSFSASCPTPLANSPFLGPIVSLASWTFVMQAWLYATRIPAMIKYKIKLDDEYTKEKMNAQLPGVVRWKADNYNHLHEQPTVFYAISLVLAMTGTLDPTSVRLAWAYVGLRVVHSLIQVTNNRIVLRFLAFICSSGMLLGLTVKAVAVTLL
eukprot:TRINITY_DN1098_c0_g1_i1.p2 TRINITY_DN1098_c0_g1~~TRINITY_DN1098_c0_g1_i1.p2  ORF type:complete len:154 (-),score=25.75 TRINITY_DN1098_c0_g1_i1:1471-1932(-)